MIRMFETLNFGGKNLRMVKSVLAAGAATGIEGQFGTF